MSSIPEIISDLGFARSQLLKAIDGLSQRELTQVPVYPGWTVKDILAHIIGWDHRVITTLPLILQNRVGEIPSVEVDEHNRASLAAWGDRPITELLAEIEATHGQIASILSAIDHREIDLRRERNGRTITIRSYVINIMTEHERQHAFEIEQWRKSLDGMIEPEVLKESLARSREEFLALITGLDEPDLLDKKAEGPWSVKDIVGHLADWEWRMLGAARHIYDPSVPEVPPVGGDVDDWNELLVARRAAYSWQHEFDTWQKTAQAVDDFLARLKPGDWRLRGAYPWPDDRGNIAGLVVEMAEHYTDHRPALERWRNDRKRLNPALRPWIHWRLNEEATGPLKDVYRASIRQAGRVWNIIRLMSLRPSTLQAALRLYTSTMQRSSPRLGRPEREMIALVVSALNGCAYCRQASLHNLAAEIKDETLVNRLAENWRTAGLPEHTRAALAFAEKLTLTPGHMTRDDVRELRRHGYSDEDIQDITQAASYFNYLSRVANALGVPPEENMEPWPREDGE